MLVVFDYMIAAMKANKKLSTLVTELFLRGRKLYILITFKSQSYFKVPKDIKLNVGHCLIMKIPNRKEFQQIVSNHSSNFQFKDFTKLYKNYTKKPFLFFVNDPILPSDNPLRSRKNLIINYKIEQKKIQ